MSNMEQDQINNLNQFDDLDQIGSVKNNRHKEKIPLSFQLQWPMIQLSNTFSSMINGYKRLFKMAPKDLKAMYLKQAQAMNQKGDTRKCVNFLEQVVIIDNKDYNIVYKLGVAYEKNKQPEGALKAYQRAITLKPDYARALYRKALLLLRKSDYKNALTELEKAIELQPDSAELYFRLGQANDRLKKYPKAIECFNKAVEINPDSLAVFKHMALTHDSMENHKEALKCLKRALEIEEME